MLYNFVSIQFSVSMTVTDLERFKHFLGGGGTPYLRNGHTYKKFHREQNCRGENSKPGMCPRI